MERGRGREKTAEEIKRKERRKGQPLRSTTDVLLPTQNPLWIRNHVGKEQRGRENTRAVDHRGIVRPFFLRIKQIQALGPKSLPHCSSNVMLLWI